MYLLKIPEYDSDQLSSLTCVSGVKMHPSYIGCRDIVLKEMALLGATHPNIEASRKGQVEHVITTIRNTPYNQEDANKLFDELLQSTEAFTFEQRKHIGRVLSDLGRGNQAVVKLRTSVNQQTMLAPHVYGRKRVWDITDDARNTIDMKLEGWATELIFCGCRNASELTRVAVIATIQARSKARYSPDDIEKYVKKLGNIMERKRKVYPGDQTMDTFPIKIGEFTRMFPDVYKSDDPPLTDMVSSDEVDELRDPSIAPCRGTNNSLSRNAHKAQKKQVNTTSMMPADSMQFNMQAIMLELMRERFFGSNSASSAGPSGPCGRSSHVSTSRKRPLALKDGKITQDTDDDDLGMGDVDAGASPPGGLATTIPEVEGFAAGTEATPEATKLVPDTTSADLIARIRAEAAESLAMEAKKRKTKKQKAGEVADASGGVVTPALAADADRDGVRVPGVKSDEPRVATALPPMARGRMAIEAQA